MMTWSITSRLRLTKDKVELGKLSVPHFLVHRVPVVDVRLHTEPAGLHQIDYFPVQRNCVGTRFTILKHTLHNRCTVEQQGQPSLDEEKARMAIFLEEQFLNSQSRIADLCKDWCKKEYYTLAKKATCLQSFQ